MDSLGLDLAYYTLNFSGRKRFSKNSKDKPKMSVEAQLDRKRKCAKRKGFQDQNNDGEVYMYVTGCFWIHSTKQILNECVLVHF